MEGVGGVKEEKRRKSKGKNGHGGKEGKGKDKKKKKAESLQLASLGMVFRLGLFFSYPGKVYCVVYFY